jgi:hypothetical protein
MKAATADVGGQAAPGFFERIREREQLQQQAQSALTNELRAARMIRSAYREGVRGGRFDPAVLSAYGELTAARGRREEKKTGLKSDLDVIADDFAGLKNAVTAEERAKNPLVYNPDLARLMELQNQVLGRSTYDAANQLRGAAISDTEQATKDAAAFRPETFGVNPESPFYPPEEDR